MPSGLYIRDIKYNTHLISLLNSPYTCIYWTLRQTNKQLQEIPETVYPGANIFLQKFMN